MTAALKIMLVAGEASGDALGAGLARAMKAKLGEGSVRFIGVGGPAMAAEGVASLFDIGDLSLFGLVELFASARRVYRRIDETAAYVAAERPDVAVLIDSWGFNIRLAKRLRRLAPDVRVVKYVAPQVWASRPGRARELAGVADSLLTLLPFEAPYFEPWGLPTTFVGNPVFGLDVSRADPARLRHDLGASPEDPVLLLLPGSRRGEIDRLLPRFEEAAGRLSETRPRLSVVVAAADSVAEAVRERVAAWARPPHVVQGQAAKLDAMRAATAAIACSGTATTELAMAGCPMVVTYRVSPLTAAIARLVIRTPYASLINIAAGAPVAPELIQEASTGSALAEAAAALLDDPEHRRRQAGAQSAALAKLKGDVADPFAAAADAVLAAARAPIRRGRSRPGSAGAD